METTTTTTTTTKFKTLPKLISLQLQLNMGRIDFKYGRIDGYDLNSLELKLNNYLQNEDSIPMG
jgi:hypothetical protein